MNTDHLPKWLAEEFEDHEWPAPKPWAKLYRKWYTTDSHIGLDGVTLGVGAALFPLINHAPCLVDSWGTAWLVHKNGTILTPAELARQTRYSVRQIKTSVNRLSNCRTIEIRSGIISLPNFERWQSTPEAWKKKKQRQRHNQTPSKDQDLDEIVEGICDGARRIYAL